MTLERLWAGWRSHYVEATHEKPVGCVFCGILSADLPATETNIVWRDDITAAVLNSFPYVSGHVMVLPVRHAPDIDELTETESQALWSTIKTAEQAIKRAYAPEGLNVGFNIGAAAGAGVPGHLHAHLVPRWAGDTNFTTTIASTRVLPESLDKTLEKLTAAWPS